MDAYIPWAVVAALICLLLYVRELRRVREFAKKYGSAAGFKWAGRFYPDRDTRIIASRFVTILESQISVPIARFTPATRFLEDLQMDDLEPVEVAMAIEEEFKIPRISNEDGQKMLAIDDVVQYLKKEEPNQALEPTAPSGRGSS